MVKGCDNKNVRALETHPKAVPWENDIQFCVVVDLQV